MKNLLFILLILFAAPASAQLHPAYLNRDKDSTIVRSSILVNAQGKKYMVDTPSLQTVTAKGDTTNKTITYTGSGIGLNAKQHLAFGINGAEYFRISPNGRALFGTTLDNGTGIIQAAGRVRAIGFASTVDSTRIAYSALLSNDEIGFYANGTVTGNAYHTYSNISASNHVFLSSANNHSTGAICLSLTAINGKAYTQYRVGNTTFFRIWFAGMENSSSNYAYKLGYGNNINAPFGNYTFIHIDTSGKMYLVPTLGRVAVGVTAGTALNDTFTVDGTMAVSDDIKQSAGDNYTSGGYRLLARNQTSGRFEQMTALLNSTGDTVVRFANSFQGTLKITNVSDADHTWTAAESIVAYTSLSANRVVTVNPATLNQGVIYTLKDKGGLAATYSLTLTLSSGTIDGSASIDINSAYGYISFYSDGTNLVVVSKN